MPLAKCPRCSRMFNKMHNLVCPGCQPAEDSDADAIRETLEEHPNLNAEQVAEVTGVDLNVVLRLIEQGGLAVASSLEASSIKCGRCGAPAISASKKLCQGCLEKLNAEVAQAQRSVHLSERKQVEVGTYHENVRQALDQKRRK